MLSIVTNEMQVVLRFESGRQIALRSHSHAGADLQAAFESAGVGTTKEDDVYTIDVDSAAVERISEAIGHWVRDVGTRPPHLPD